MKVNGSEVRVKIAGICISMNIGYPPIYKRAVNFYQDFLSQKEPEVAINVRYGDFKKPSADNLICHARLWDLGEVGEQRFVYFRNPSSENRAIAWFDSSLNSFDFCTNMPDGNFLLHVFPEVFYPMVLSQREGMMLHACGVLNGDKGFLFVGPSGSGKSTIASLSSNKVMNEERVIVRNSRNGFRMYGAPGYGERAKALPDGTTIGKIFVLEKAKTNFAALVPPISAAVELMKSPFRPFWDSGAMKRTFQFCVELAQKVPCYRLSFLPNKSVWQYLDNFEKKPELRKG